MTSAHTANQPTPARDVIADWLDDSYGSRDDFLAYADAMIRALAEAGYRIAEAGTVTISRETAYHANEALKHAIVVADFDGPYTDYLAPHAELEAALAATSEPDHA